MPKRRRYDAGPRTSPPTYGELFDAVGFLLELAGHEVERDQDDAIDPETNEFWCELVDLVRRFPSFQVGRDGARRLERGDLAQVPLLLELAGWFDGLRRSGGRGLDAEAEELGIILTAHGWGESLDKALRLLHLNDGDEAPLESFQELLGESKSPMKCAQRVVAAVTPSGERSMSQLSGRLPGVRERRRTHDGDLVNEEARAEAALVIRTSSRTLQLRGAAFAMSSDELLAAAEASLLRDLGLDPGDLE